MFFEGSEKKAEIWIEPSMASLRALPQSFWIKMVSLAKADILSQISNDQCDAYLLSESSLFVWDHKVVILTCGLSTLIDSVNDFINSLGTDNILFLTYQRKNEYVAHLQSSTFIDDITTLKQIVSGTACRVGHLDNHHHYIFTSGDVSLISAQDNTCEVLMYHISGVVADYLRTEQQSISKIYALLQLDELFAGFTYDAHLFTPLGFSINGIKDDLYYTIHITPQEKSSYVSFETNVDLNHSPSNIAAKLLAILQPRSWDIIGFNSVVAGPNMPENICLGHCSYPVKQGYNIHFSHYQQLCPEVLSPEFL
ncbi:MULTISPECIES: adenosylmethionine decarboxylase [Pseudomonadati]|uniref:S-adenosylmethionine decarboxylase proenzyme n=1 Tax=Shewanella aestuarii TaxID=1028752 RepID=A0ABT0KXQ0_9GAMM|nr:adenosylmethionine decarboxylase [Shewanella aestuarii]MCL1116249.1 S-adenosylmethionine decarboxylase proenzyme [Shewanella aestuarii]GGN71197.1 S-adenosylmethionine decarboxylase SpeD [Shewanella aestuarii]